MGVTDIEEYRRPYRLLSAARALLNRESAAKEAARRRHPSGKGVHPMSAASGIAPPPGDHYDVDARLVGTSEPARGGQWRAAGELAVGMQVRAVAHFDCLERWYPITEISDLGFPRMTVRRMRLGDGRPVDVNLDTEVLTRRLHLV